jgi:stage III sporulation protein AD
MHMEILQIVTLGIIASILYIVTKELNSSFAFYIIIIMAVIIFLSIIQQIGAIFNLIESLGQRANVDGMYMKTILQIIGIAYIADLGSSIVKDAGLDSVAAKIELAGKIFILILAVPIITAVIEAILSFLPA